MPTPINLNTKEALSEVSQAKIRVRLHLLFVALTFLAYNADPAISLPAVSIISVASLASALALFFWARCLQNKKSIFQQRLILRSFCILSDNLFVTLVLAIGGGSTAGLWTIYLWTSIGYGVRYGVNYLRANVLVSSGSFLIMAATTPFWSARPPFVMGMLLGMILVPAYTSFLITQLHLAVREKDSAYRAKSEFLARMSHELRTPLHAIISAAELLKGKSKSQVQNDYVDVVALSSSTLLELINRILDLSKFESGTIGLAKETINLRQLMADAANLVYPQACAKGIDVRVYSDPDIPSYLVGSPAHLKEVLLNILGNAVKFTDAGFIAISATLNSSTATHSEVAFEVTDTGCGIPERDLARIFEPFMQADSTRTRRHEGTGLGTSFSREIVRLMGGEITITSTLGLGTQVRFAIPFERLTTTIPENLTYSIRLGLLADQSPAATINNKILEFGPSLERFGNVQELVQALMSDKSGKRIVGVIVDADAYGDNLPSVFQMISNAIPSRIIPVAGFGAAALRTAAISNGFCSYFGYTASRQTIANVLSSLSSFSSSYETLPEEFSTQLPLRPLKVLVADDNATNRTIAQVSLEQAGHSCTLVDNGDDALFALNDVRFDVALLDMHMPGRDGIEVAKIYRFAHFNGSEHTPIILLTADSTLEAREEAESAGVSAFLTKPILPSEIVRIVEKIGGTAVTRIDITASSDRVSCDPTNSAPTESLPIIDDCAVTELIGLMTKEEQIQFFSEFSDDSREYIAKLRSAHSATDVAPAKEAMHALAGAALIIGAPKLANVARRLERLDQGALLIDAKAHASELATVMEQTLIQIKAQYFP